MKKIIQFFLITMIVLALQACSIFTDKDNTPRPETLVNFTPAVNIHPVWYVSTGQGSRNDYIKLSPAISGNTIFTASKNGAVTANDKITGKSIWQVNINAAISAGTAAYDDLVYVGTPGGDTFALRQTDGKIMWKAAGTSEILAPAAASHGMTLVKTIDGRISAFATRDGQAVWHYQQNEPSLILRGASAPQISRESVIVGFENGNLTKLSLQQGRVQFEKNIAEPKGIFAIQRMIDIDADPIILNHRVYAATYQGRIAALDFTTGQTFWTHDISSYSGIAADNAAVYISDARSRIFALSADSGDVNWLQNKLEARTITGPALFGDYIVVGDAEGYLHWMSKSDGHFVARIFVNRSGMLATPLVDHHMLYVYTKDGHLAAYMIG